MAIRAALSTRGETAWRYHQASQVNLIYQALWEEIEELLKPFIGVNATPAQMTLSSSQLLRTRDSNQRTYADKQIQLRLTPIGLVQMVR